MILCPGSAQGNLHRAIAQVEQKQLSQALAQYTYEQQLAKLAKKSYLRREVARSNYAEQFAYSNLQAAFCGATLRNLLAKLHLYRVQIIMWKGSFSNILGEGVAVADGSAAAAGHGKALLFGVRADFERGGLGSV